MLRWQSIVFHAVLLASAFAETDTAAGSYNATSVTLAASVSVIGGGVDQSTLALRDLAVLVLDEARVSANVTATPPACDLPDDLYCLQAVLTALSNGDASVAVVTIPAENTPAALQLREAGILELGEISPLSRRACLTTRPPARSLLDLTDPALAAIYHIPVEDVNSYLCTSCNINEYAPEWCTNGNTTCAVLLTSSKAEARLLSKVVHVRRLYATVLPLEANLYNAAKNLAARPIIACDWALQYSPLTDLPSEYLGPPPCLDSEQYCLFETRRLVKLINIRHLSSSPSSIRSLKSLKLNPKEFRTLSDKARESGHGIAAKAFFEERPATARRTEVRVTVMLPNATRREVYDAKGLAAAAAMAEVDFERDKPSSIVKFKVETYDDGCHTARAYKFLNDAKGTSEFDAISAVAGPACGAVWPDMVHQTAAFKLPILAYTPQAPVAAAHGLATDLSGTEQKLQLLAAGDAREISSAFGELLKRMRWKRLAALTEPATRPLAEAVRAHAEFAVHVELADNGADVDFKVISNWATRVAAAKAHIIYLCVEDARVARATLCAARTAGVTSQSGAVWLLCSKPMDSWLQTTATDNCTRGQLEEVAAGYLTVTPEWEIAWNNNTAISTERQKWEARWLKHCKHFAGHSCLSTSPTVHAAVLYDVLKLWAGALDTLLMKQPYIIDDLHNVKHISSLLEIVTTSNSSTLTGPFNWSTDGSAYVRQFGLVLSQWDARTGIQTVGHWDGDKLTVDDQSLRWYTADGRQPDDGSDNCALQGLANALNSDCGTAYAVVGALLVTILVAALAAVALHCKRRAEKEYRKRLQALGMRPLLGKPIGLDRWEVPRERVVINRKLGTGAFGTVYGGHSLLVEDRGWTAVAVKTLKAGASMEEKLDFLSEAEAMKRFDHKNVVRLLGVVTKTEPVCTVMEFMLYGDLKNYLLARRHLAVGGGGFYDEPGESREIREADEASPRRLTGMALDVARALSYLAQLRYVHRDVAARNCLVSARRVVKLADFGMTRLVFENDYYRFSRKGMLPVRWMAPESLALGVFSPASDVWSFGVLLYEIVTFGSLPHQGLSNAEVLARVKGGHTLELPPGLKPQLEGLIKSCWQQESKSRPTASEVAAFLADAPRLLTPCLDIPLDALSLDSEPPWHLPRDQAEARWVSWAAPASQTTDTTYLSTDGAIPLDTDSFLP